MKPLYIEVLSILAGATFLPLGEASAAPHISRGVSVRGAIAYQDDRDSSQFHYVPTVTQLGSIGSGSLKAFNVSYFGLGPRYYVCDTGSICRPGFGGIIGATVNVDLENKTRSALIKEIKNRFAVDNPKLLPVRLSNVKAQSLLVDSLSTSKISEKFSTAFQFGQDSGFSAGSLSSLFGANLATTAEGVGGIVPNPQFQVEFVGEVEVVGDPWIVEATCDLTQAWSHIRSSASVSANLGWFSIGHADYESLVEDLKRTGICSYKEVQGSLDVKNDILPTLEMMKKIFEEMNAQAASGEGFFKFEPNPDPPEVSAGGASSVWPWSVSLNAGYSSASFNQNITKTVRAEISPRFPIVIGSTIVMAAKCTPQTKQYFTDLGDPSEACITPQKVKIFNNIAEQVRRNLDDRLGELRRDLAAKRIDLPTYLTLRQNAIEDAAGTFTIVRSKEMGGTPFIVERVP